MRTKKRFLGILFSLVVVLGIMSGMRPLLAVADELYDGQILLSELKTATYFAEKADGGSNNVFVRNMALQRESTAQSNNHSIVLEDRKNMTLTGIKEVSSFNEQKIVLLTERDQLTTTGRSMHLKSFNPKTGDLSLDGTIDSLIYEDKNINRGSFWERLK